jgi:hypothetical protein
MPCNTSISDLQLNSPATNRTLSRYKRGGHKRRALIQKGLLRRPDTTSPSAMVVLEWSNISMREFIAIRQVHTAGFIPHTYNKDKTRSTDRLKHAEKDSEGKERSKIFHRTIESDA